MIPSRLFPAAGGVLSNLTNFAEGIALGIPQ